MTKADYSKGRVLIIGGSMAGLFAAIMLRSRGWKVDVYERASEELANRGAGIATHDELYKALREAGIELRDEMGVRCYGRIMFDADGSVLGTYDMPQIMTSWGLIYRFLREQLSADEYHNGHALVGIETSAGGVTAVFENGARESGDWLIGADGARSTVRTIVAPEIRNNYCGYFGWRGLIDEKLIAPEVLEAFAERLALGMAPGGHWLGYLVAGPDDALEAGRRWFNWGWYRTGDDEMLRDLLTDGSGRYHEHGIPHDLIRREHVERLRDEARQYLAPQIQAVVNATEWPFIQGMSDFASERLIRDRTILIGDAAFTARPHVGLGVSKAADDASSLARALSDTDQATALERWESERLAYGNAVVQWGRDLGSYIGPQPDDAAHRAKAEYHQRPEVLMAATAASDPSRYLN
ncbi:MAG: FAD-dependent monooxygenase [Gammaproteobacteria bacterium]|nr:FAD-dependent monooxygenase [Gammaproteobacteria bacterium]